MKRYTILTTLLLSGTTLSVNNPENLKPFNKVCYVSGTYSIDDIKYLEKAQNLSYTFFAYLSSKKLTTTTLDKMSYLACNGKDLIINFNIQVSKGQSNNAFLVQFYAGPAIIEGLFDVVVWKEGVFGLNPSENDISKLALLKIIEFLDDFEVKWKNVHL